MHPTPGNAATRPIADITISFVHMCMYILYMVPPVTTVGIGAMPSSTAPNGTPKLHCMQDASDVAHDAVAVL